MKKKNLITLIMGGVIGLYGVYCLTQLIINFVHGPNPFMILTLISGAAYIVIGVYTILVALGIWKRNNLLLAAPFAAFTLVNLINLIYRLSITSFAGLTGVDLVSIVLGLTGDVVFIAAVAYAAFLSYKGKANLNISLIGFLACRVINLVSVLIVGGHFSIISLLSLAAFVVIFIVPKFIEAVTTETK